MIPNTGFRPKDKKQYTQTTNSQQESYKEIRMGNNRQNSISDPKPDLSNGPEGGYGVVLFVKYINN